MKWKSVEKVSDVLAVATFSQGLKAKVHLRSWRMGDETATPLSMEDSKIKMGVAIEWLDDNGNPTGEYELYKHVEIVTTVSSVKTLTFGEELKKWFVDEVCGLHSIDGTE